MAEELRRRIRNTDRGHKKEEVVTIPDKFIGKMANSGYSVSSRREVIRSGVVKYYRELLEWKTGGRRLYRTPDQMGQDRRFKGMEKMTWFRSKRGGKQVTVEKNNPWLAQQRQMEQGGQRIGQGRTQRKAGGRAGECREAEAESETAEEEGRRRLVIEAVAFVPYTPRFALKKELQRVDDSIAESLGRPKIRFVERGGGQIIQEVGRPNPWASETECQRNGCEVCKGRRVIGAEKEEEASKMVTGKDGSGA